MKEVSIFGLGYIGLPTAAVFASHGVRVKGVDVNQNICDIINRGSIHIVEDGLEEKVRTAVKSGMLHASTVAEPCENFIISVPTPITASKCADLSYVVSVAKSIVPVLRPGNLVILESTVSPRCTEDILVPVLETSGLKAGKDFMVAHCPERVLPGNILYELENNNRVIGGVTPESAAAARELYGVFVKGEMVLTNTTTAEMCKLMENTFRDVNIALANELAMVCERLGINVWDVIRFSNKHPRVNIHQPGPGVGGHCIAVDPWFVVESVPDLAKIMELARRTNDGMPAKVLDHIKSELPAGSRLVFLGCTYKPDVDDMRESPIIELVELASHAGYETTIVDPLIQKYNVDVYQALQGADMAILGVNHKAFRTLDLSLMHSAMRTPILYDTRSFFDVEKVRAAGMKYLLLGCGIDLNNGRA